MFRRALLVSLLSATLARAGEPVVRALSLRGLQIGGNTTLVIDGDELGTAPKLLLPFSIKQSLQPKSTAAKATFDVTLDDSVPPGYYHLRVQNDEGVSLPTLIAVDRMPQRPAAASVDTLPVALHGSVAGSATVETKFPGKKGDKITVEVEAQRLGSKLRPILHLYSQKRLQLAWSWHQPALVGDTRLEATLPEDGQYTVALHDVEYAAANPSFYRLRIGQWNYADFVFPPALSRNSVGSVDLIGSSATPVPVKVGAEKFQALDWPKGGLWSGPRPFITISPGKEIVRKPGADKIHELPAGAVGVSSLLLTPFSQDLYKLAVTPGQKFRFEVFSERLGSPLDCNLQIQGEKGQIIATAKERPGTLDPVLEYKVTDKVTQIFVAVTDTQGRGGPKGLYRLVVEPQSGRGGEEDFQLTTTAQRLTLPEGGFAVLPVTVERQGYTGPVEVAAADLPKGFQLEGTTIPAGADGTLITLRRGTKTGDAVLTQWKGRAADGNEKSVLIKGHPLEKLQPWLASEVALGLTTRNAKDFQVEWKELPKDVGWVPGAKLKLPVKVTRADLKDTVRLTLLHTQTTVIVNNQPDANSNLKIEKTPDIAAKATEGEMVVSVPASLGGSFYDAAIQAELLDDVKKSVIATAYTPVRRLEVLPPLKLALEGGNKLEAKLDPKTGATVKIKGTIERKDGLAGDVTIALAGLPAEAKADGPVVKAAVKEFVVTVVLPPTFEPGELKGLRLTATAPLDAKTPNVRVRARDVSLTLVVK